MSTVQMLNIVLVVILALILLLGLVAILLIYKIRKKEEPQEKENIQIKDKKENPNLITRTGKAINSIYKFMEFDEVTDNMIIRKNRQQYVMVIQCKGINYDLLSEDEKNAVEAGFVEFLNTLRFPVQLYIQTRTLNLSEILNEYDKRIEDINSQIIKINSQIQMAQARGNLEAVNRLQFEKKRKENILEYGESIEEYTAKISESRNILQQKTYIVISYFTSEYGDVSTYSKEEINDIAFTELYTRAQTLIRALSSAEVSGKVLNSEEIAELLYVAYNRDQSERYTLRDALNAQYDRLYSTARDVLEEKKARINRQVEEEASRLAAKSLVKADEINKKEKEKRVKERAMEMIDEYKGEISNQLYKETQKQIQNANLDEQNKEGTKRRIIKAVKEDDIKFIPKRYEKTYFNWMENIQDWCISRQLWWGHRIPAYYCDKCGHITVAKETPSKCESCGSTELHQDPDTLDTWFSSALWPFSTMGWPDTESEDFKTFFPTNTLVTGYDIILFWVIRMVFSSYYATKEQPFKDVVIHGLVRDSQGRKMSKSLGNGIDPLEIIDKYGADSLRFSLISGTTMGNDIKYMPEKLEQASNFANKIWNAAKFISNNISSREEIIAFCKDNTDARTGKFKQGSLKIEDEWIINELETLVNKVTKNINDYDLGIALDNIYTFIWDEFCDWYIEMAKSRLYSEDQAEKVQVSYVLNYVFKQAMQLLHPFMPFVTSEIYASLASCKEVPLMLTKWPDGSKKVEYDTNKDTIGKFKEIIVGIRNIRANMDIHPSKKAELIFVTTKYAKEIDESRNFLQKLGMGSEIKIQSDKTGISDNSISVITEGIELYMPFEDLVNIKEEIARLEKEKEKLEKEVQRSKGILSNKGFLEKAPESKINDEKDKLIKYTKMLEDIKARIASMQ